MLRTIRLPTSRVDYDSVENVTTKGAYLHSAFKVKNDSLKSDLWIADSGASCHMTHNTSSVYDIRPPPPSREAVKIGENRCLKVKHVDSVDVEFYRYIEMRIFQN